MNVAKKYNILKSFLGYKLLKKRTPIFVTFKVTNRCNFKCPKCKRFVKKKELTTYQIFHLIEEISSLGTQILSLGGGDPLFRADIREIIRFAKNRGIFTILFTNGVLLSEKIDLIRDIDFLFITLDAYANTPHLKKQDKILRGIYRSIDVANKNNINFGISIEVSRYNLDKIKDLIIKLKRLNIRLYLQSSRGLSLNKDLKNNSNKEKLEGIINFAIKQKKNKGLIENSFQNLYQTINWIDTGYLNTRCYAKNTKALIDSQGNVYPCEILQGDPKAMNSLECGFKKSFDNLNDFVCKDSKKQCIYANTEWNNLLSFNFRYLMS